MIFVVLGDIGVERGSLRSLLFFFVSEEDTLDRKTKPRFIKLHDDWSPCSTPSTVGLCGQVVGMLGLPWIQSPESLQAG